jgi:hypothetical protein
VAIALAVVPPAYLFVAIQHGAVTYPFWDHTDLLRSLAPLYDGNFKLSSLWAPHNHSRPLTLRVIYLANARLTDWDIRSEYVFMYAAIYGGFALHVSILWRLTGRRLGLVFAGAALLLSLLYFSPAGHMNHWWSMMFQLDLANVLIVYAIWRIARDPVTTRSSVIAAAAGWLATYTLTNGLVAMIVLAILAHAVRPRPLIPGRHTLFWVANLLALYALYFHDLPAEPVAHPNPFELVWFACIYLGAPIGYLLSFRFLGLFDVPLDTWLNGACGIVLLALGATFVVRDRERIRRGDAAALLLLGFSLFALGSAVLTGWARARLDATGVAQAGTSRYVIFGSFLAYALIHYAAARASSPDWRLAVPAPTRVVRAIRPATAAAVGVAVVSFAVVASAITYERGLSIYRTAHLWNGDLGRAYALTPEARRLARWIYAFPQRSEEVKADLLRLHLAPYRDTRTADVPGVDVAGPPRQTVLLTPGSTLQQTFAAGADRLVMASVAIDTAAPIRGDVRWTLWRLEADGTTRVGSVVVTLDGAKSRETVAFVTGDLGRTAGRRYRLSLEPVGRDDAQVTIPLYAVRRTDGRDELIVGRRRMASLAPRLTLTYARG